MRAPKRRKPLRRRVASHPPELLEVAATRATYRGSPEHKGTPSFAGQPRPRADASICDPALYEQGERIEGWLRAALGDGTVGELLEGDFPRYVWYHDRDANIVYEARLINRGLGEYKGYPLAESEWPPGIAEHAP